MKLSLKAFRFNRDQRGASMAEFVIVAGFFFTLIVGIIEFGRLMYTHNALADATRRAARYAVLHEKDDPCVKYVAVYGETHITKSGSPAVCTPNGPALINGLTTTNVNVTWEGQDEDADPDTAPSTAYGMNLGTATVTISNYDFILSVPFFRQTLRMPAYRTTLTAESAGTEP